MICTSFGNIGFAKLAEQLASCTMAEIRIDLLSLSDAEVEQIFSLHKNLIATCRPDKMGTGRQEQLLTLAIQSGAAYVDLEIEAAADFKQRMMDVARDAGCKTIISYHNYTETPRATELHTIVDTIFAEGAQIAKVATMAHSNADAARIMALYADYQSLVAVAMGAKGKITRIAAPLLGAPFTFAAPNGMITAAGQLDSLKMESIYKIISTDA